MERESPGSSVFHEWFVLNANRAKARKSIDRATNEPPQVLAFWVYQYSEGFVGTGGRTQGRPSARSPHLGNYFTKTNTIKNVNSASDSINATPISIAN